MVHLTGFLRAAMTENWTAKNSVLMKGFLMVTCLGYQMECSRDHMMAGCWGLKMDALMGIPKQKDYNTRGATNTMVRHSVGQGRVVKRGHD